MIIALIEYRSPQRVVLGAFASTLGRKRKIPKARQLLV